MNSEPVKACKKLKKIKNKKQPLYRQIADRIRRYIIDNDLKPGAPLFSQNALIKHFDVSQITVRQATQQLISEGIITSIQGKGTFVAASQVIGNADKRLLSDEQADSPLVGGITIDVTEVKKAEESPKTQLEVKNLIARLSAEFINLPGAKIDMKIDESLKLIAETLNIDRILLHEFSEERQQLCLSHFFKKPGIKTPTSIITSKDQPGFTTAILNNKIIRLERVDNLPEAWEREREYLMQQGVKSGLAIPLTVGKEPVGALTFTTVYREQSWTDEVIEQLQLISEVFANALDRKCKEQKLHNAFAEIEKQLQFEKLISALSAEFINLHPDQIDKKIVDGLKRISEYLDMDRIALLQFSEDKTEFHLSHSYAMDPRHRAPIFNVSKRLPWYTETLKKGKTVRISGIGDMPEEAVAERQYLKAQGIKSFLTIPMKVAGSTIGAVSYSCMKSERTWPDEIVKHLKLINEIFANTLDRKYKEQKLHKTFKEIKQLKDRIQKENIYLRQEVEVKYRHDKIVGKSEGLKRVLALAEKVAKQDTSCLILGETGTGKEMLAHVIHNLSSRKDHAMIAVNCAALPASLIESEMFGREKGAYTGALTRSIGRFEAAHGSTIFLDEVGELPPEIQIKLLRILQDGKFERLGSTKTVTVNVRVITATHRNLADDLKIGKFRNDLYYRLNVFPITIPPLRDRQADIPLLVWSFVREFEKAMGKKIESIPQSSMELLQAYSWPGNVRELKNVIERTMILSTGPVLRINRVESEEVPAPKDTLDDTTRNHILRVLESTGWCVSGKNGAAEILGLKRTTLLTKMKRLNIQRPKE